MSYDATSEPNEFIADTRADAVAKAVRFFGVEEGELRIAEPAEVFGLGGRTAIVAIPRNVVARPSSGGGGDRDRDRDRGGRERGGRGRERGGRDRGRDRDRGGRDRGEGRGGRGEGRGESRGEGRGESRGEGRGESRGEGRGESRGDRDRDPEPVAAAGPVPSKGTAEGSLSPIGEYVLGIVERMGLGNFTIAETEEDDFLVIQLEGQAADRLGTDDRGVGAIQLLANQAAMRADEEPKRVVVDCEGDADQRESFLERTAGRAARRAKETSRSVALDPMNARDRRALHMAVRNIDGVATMSVGTGRYRQVVIVPEGAPEYEEALEASRDAASRDRERD